jgi:S1-C subfamily serine protease
LVVAGCGGGKDGTSSGPTAHTAASSSPTAPAVQTTTSGTADLEQRFVEVVRAVSPSVVLIESSDGLGSGVVYDDAGHIVTNNHVVGSNKTFTVTLAGGDRHKATLVGAFPPDDLAVVHLESGSPPVATFGDSSALEVGQVTLAMGNPLGLRSSVTDGIVSSLGRTVSEGNGAVISAAIQTSAAINPGNSGGALVDLDGEVIGIPTLAATDPKLGGGQAPGIGFAIPSNTVKRIASQLIETGKVTNSGRAFLGIQVASTVLRNGVAVGAVERGEPAERAGIKAGDIITEIDGKPVTSAEDLVTTLADLKPGEKVTVAITRPDGTKKTVEVTLAQAKG